MKYSVEDDGTAYCGNVRAYKTEDGWTVDNPYAINMKSFEFHCPTKTKAYRLMQTIAECAIIRSMDE